MGENSPKIQGGPKYDQFWSSRVERASRYTEITPLNPLGRRNLGSQTYQKRGKPPIFSPPPATRVAVLSLCKALGQAKHANSRIQPLKFVDQKSRKFGEKSPKIQGGPQHGQFWNLSSPTDPASRSSKIGPLDPLGRINWGVKFLSLSLNF